jgi:hypothetical protein
LPPTGAASDDNHHAVAVLGPEIAFVEFKFYDKRKRFDLDKGRFLGFKGGPGEKNYSEFQDCIDRLAERPPVPDLELSKYVVLFYADPSKRELGRQAFSKSYDHFEHPNAKLLLKRRVPADDYRIRCQLYKIVSDGRRGTTSIR